jgi:hypothetical protein
MGINIVPSGATVSLSETLGNTHKVLSGVEWLTSGNSITIASACNNLAMKSYRNSNILKIEWSEFGKDDEFFAANRVFSSIPPNKSSVANINTSLVPIPNFSIGGNGYVSENDNAKLTVRYFDPHDSESSIVSSNYNMRIDTYTINNGSDSLIENFTGEDYRFTKTVIDSNLSNSSVNILGGSWVSSTNITNQVGGEYSLQVAYKKLIYPNKDYSSTIPIGPDYSSLTNDRTYYRLFEGIAPFNGGTITFEGLENALDEIISKDNIEVYLHLPGVSSYHFGGGFENGNIFQDLGIYQNVPGGCLAYTGGSGESVDFSFNTDSSASSNYKCFIKIKIKNTNVSINKITFSPTYA